MMGIRTSAGMSRVHPRKVVRMSAAALASASFSEQSVLMLLVMTVKRVVARVVVPVVGLGT